MSREFTLADVFDAIEKNGLLHIQGNYYRREDNKIGACALGQAAYNLNCPIDDLTNALYQFKLNKNASLSDGIILRNDSSGLSLKEIADWGRRRFPGKLKTVLIVSDVPNPHHSTKNS